MAPANGKMKIRISHAREAPTGRRLIRTRTDKPMIMIMWAAKIRWLMRLIHPILRLLAAKPIPSTDGMV